MAKEVAGEVAKDAPQITRRAFLFWGTVVTASAVLSIMFGPRPGQTVSYDSEQDKLARDLQATAVAGQGRPIVGNAPGHFPERTLELVRAATSLLIVVYKDGDTTASAGTAWKTEFDGAHATAAHVLTRHGQRELRDIEQIWLGRPFSDLGFQVLKASDVKLTLPQGYTNADTAHDMATIQIARKVTPSWVANAQGLRLAGDETLQTGEEVMAAGIPAQYLVSPDDTGLRVTPLYASVMQVTGQSFAPGTYALHGEANQGMSGGSVTRANGSVVGMVIGNDTQDRYLTAAIPTATLAELASRL